MGIKSQAAQGPSLNLRYSAFLGFMYVGTQENEAAVAEAKALVGDVEVRKGYTGRTGSTLKAQNFLREKGITATQVSGRLNSAYIRDVDTTSGTVPYLNVGLSDKDGRYYVSAPVSLSGVQMLIRKLVNAVPGEDVDLNLFATYDKSTNPLYAGRMFASHGASLIQDGAQVPGADVSGLQKAVEVQVNALKDAGVTDTTIINAARGKCAVNYHLELMKTVTEKFSKYWEENQAEGAEAEAAQAAPAPATTGGSFDDFEDDIPFGSL